MKNKKDKVEEEEEEEEERITVDKKKFNEINQGF